MELQDIIELCLIGACIVTLAVLIVVRDLMKKSQKKVEQRAYREKYVSEVTLSDARFGTLTGDYDCYKHTLFADNLDLPALGKNKPTVISADDYTPDRNSALLHAMCIAYDNAQNMLSELAKGVQLEMQFALDQSDIPSAEEIIALITFTEFQFVFDAEQPVMQVIGGVEYDAEQTVMSFGLNAMYRINEKSWEFDAERIGA